MENVPLSTSLLYIHGQCSLKALKTLFHLHVTDHRMKAWQCSLSLQCCKMFHSGTQQFTHGFSTLFTDSLKLMSLTNYCLQRVQFYCMLYVTDSPYSVSQNTLNSSIMFISHIYKQYNEVDDHEVAILVFFGARSPHFRFWTQPNLDSTVRCLPLALV